MTTKTIAVLGFGEAGAAIGKGLAPQMDRAANETQLMVIDVALDEGDAGQEIRRRADELGIEIVGDYGPKLKNADVVLSVVTCAEAYNAAEAAAPYLKREATYLDFNTVTRSIAEANAAVITAVGANYIDVAVMGSFHVYGHRPPLLIAGPTAKNLEPWMTERGFVVEVMDGPAGVASAVKILRSIMMKGIEALGVEFLVAAHSQGLLDEALACTKDVDQRGFGNFIQTLVTTHIVHAKRRHEEVVLVNQMLRDCGIEPMMSAATERSHSRTLDNDATRPGGPVPDLAEALDILTNQVVKVSP